MWQNDSTVSELITRFLVVLTVGMSRMASGVFVIIQVHQIYVVLCQFIEWIMPIAS